MIKKEFHKYLSKIEKQILIRYFFLITLTYIFLNNFFLYYIQILYTNIIYFFLNLFIPIKINSNIILIKSLNISFEVINACVANQAYILIGFIFLSIPIKNIKILFIIIVKSFILFSIFNLLRILLLIIIYFYFGEVWFKNLHLLFYEFLSGVITGIIIIYYLRKYNNYYIKNQRLPIISDLKNILKEK